MGLLGLACIFSTLVVIDGPLLQRSSRVITAPVIGKPRTLNVTMAPELPQDFTGIRASPADMGWPNGHWSISFNETIPTSDGEAPNDVFVATDDRLALQVSPLWWNDLPLGGVFQGCSDECTTKMRAPALFPTSCKTEQIPITYVQYFMYYNEPNVLKTITASPLNSQVLIVGINLLLDVTEKVVIITGAANAEPGAADPADCVATLKYTTCTFEAGVGEYDVLIQNDKILVESIGKPRLISLANNTQAAHNITQNKDTRYLNSTLAGIVDMMSNRWETSVAYWKGPDGGPKKLSMANMGTEQYQKEGDQMCPSFKDPYDDVIQSLNKLMVYLGFFAAQNVMNNNEHGAMDSGLSVQFTTDGYPSGEQDVYHVSISMSRKPAMTNRAFPRRRRTTGSSSALLLWSSCVSLWLHRRKSCL